MGLACSLRYGKTLDRAKMHAYDKPAALVGRQARNPVSVPEPKRTCEAKDEVKPCAATAWCGLKVNAFDSPCDAPLSCRFEPMARAALF